MEFRVKKIIPRMYFTWSLIDGGRWNFSILPENRPIS